MNDSKSINLKPAICTQCGATIEVDPRQEAAICKFCGTSFIVEKAIIDYNIQNMTVKHVDSINVVKTSPLDSILKFADKQISRRADEKRRVEEEARIQREKTDAFFKKYWWAIAALLIAPLIFLLIGAANESKNSAGKIIIGYSSSELAGKNYEEVVTNLENAGFINVETKAIDDLITGWLTNDGEVEKVSINGDTDFSASSKYPYDSKIMITYHTFPSTETEQVPETTETPEATEAMESTESTETTETSGASGETANLLAEPLDLNAINGTNSAKSDAQFVGKYYRVIGIIDQALEASDGLNAMVITEPDVMAKGMGSTLPLEINIWLTADEFEKIGGISSVGKQIDISVKLTNISRNTISKDSAVKGYPIQLEFGESD